MMPNLVSLTNGHLSTVAPITKMKCSALKDRLEIVICGQDSCPRSGKFAIYKKTVTHNIAGEFILSN